MEYNINNEGENREVVRERETNATAVWYVVLGLLVLGLVIWYGYRSGWFSARDTGPEDSYSEVDSNGLYPQDVPVSAAPIDSLSIETLESFPVQKILVVKGTLPNSCVYLNSPVQLRDGNVFYVTIDTRTEGDVCTQALQPYEQRIPLEVSGLPSGVYIVKVNGREITFELENDNKIDFSAGSDK